MSMKPFLIQSASEPNRCWELPRGVALFIGRNRDLDIVIQDGTVGHVHAVVVAMPNGLGLVVVTLDATNGVWVDGENKPIHRLKIGQQFRIAHDFWFRVTE